MDSSKCDRKYDLEKQNRHPEKLKHFAKLAAFLGEKIGWYDENCDSNPLPRNNRSPGQHQGAYTKCKYRYIGAQSEGNRFISNNDL